eukprot:TRINITY_DN2951_c0_g1_i1.p1 TRINITY_DN2951_c0_g1~~TRINITY_DN2951_c0_g1_i1.p1  ORF type:complete len:579 (+),score=181.75 TRINITY_DN2951_c0_g1_i1:201-1937(+)
MSANMQRFQVEPCSTTEKFVCYARLPPELLQYLANRKNNGGNISVRFEKTQNVFSVDDQVYTFRSEEEPSSQNHDCFVQEDGTWNKIGCIQRKLFFDQQLSELDRDRVKRRSEEAEAAKKQHISVRLDPSELMNKGKKHKTTKTTTIVRKEKKPKYIDMSSVTSNSKPKSTVPDKNSPEPAPKPSRLSIPQLRKTIIQLLAARSKSSAEVAKDIGSQASQNDIVKLLEEVATFRKSIWHLKEEVYPEIDQNWEGYSESDKVKVQNFVKGGFRKDPTPSTSVERYSSQDESSSQETSRFNGGHMTSSGAEESPRKKAPVVKEPPKDLRVRIQLPKTKTKEPAAPPVKKDEELEAPPASVTKPKVEPPQELKKEQPLNIAEIKEPAANGRESDAPSASETENKKEEVKPQEKKKALVTIPNPKRLKALEEKKRKAQEIQDGSASDSAPLAKVLKMQEDRPSSSEAPKKTPRVSGPQRGAREIKNADDLLQCKVEFERQYAEYIRQRDQIVSVQGVFKQLGEDWEKVTDPAEKQELNNKITNLFHEHYEKTQKLKEAHSKRRKDLDSLKQMIVSAQTRLKL